MLTPFPGISMLVHFMLIVIVKSARWFFGQLYEMYAFLFATTKNPTI